MFSYGQTSPIGHWQTHLSYYNNSDLCLSGKKIYCAGPSGLFNIDTDTRETTKYNTLQGLSEIDVSVMRYDSKRNSLIVAYANTIIDILRLNEENELVEVIPISDVFRKSILGIKTINDILIDNDLAYLSTSFGIVVIDLNKNEVKDTYSNIGPSGSVLPVNALAFFNNTIYVASANGIFSAPANAPNLSDYNYWSEAKASSYSNLIVNFDGKLFAVVDSILQQFDGTLWAPAQGATTKATLAYYSNNDNLILTQDDGFLIRNQQGSWQQILESFPQKAILQGQNIWFIKKDLGLISKNIQTGAMNYFTPIGPLSNLVFDVRCDSKSAWVASGAYTSNWAPTGNNYKFLRLSNNEYLNFGSSNSTLINPLRDFVVIELDKENSKSYVGTFGSGLLELSGEEPITLYNQTNSSLELVAAGLGGVRISGLALDSKGNLWVSNHLAANPLSVKLKDGTWKSFSFGNLLSGNNQVAEIVIDNQDQKWIVSPRGFGIVVYNDNKTPTNENDDQFRLLNKNPGNGGLPSNNVLCLAKDMEGPIWVGTDDGIAVFYSPSNVFKSATIDAQLITVKINGVVGHLLKGESVTCIKVDGANRKWIGTKNGLWLFSDDGTKILQYFTKENSPLLSNNILSIDITDATGEVYVGTDKGLMSYRGTATKAEEEFNDVYAFPNPVPSGYSGSIAIKGLIEDATVKITDIAGNLVFETVSLGGQAIWDGNDFNGRRVNSGIYLVYAASEDGTKNIVTKIAVIR